VTANKGYGPQFGETVYISEVNEARKVKSYVQVAMSKNSDTVQKVFPKGWLGKTVPQVHFSKLPKLSETSRARKVIFELQVTIKLKPCFGGISQFDMYDSDWDLTVYCRNRWYKRVRRQPLRG